jgi:hypothetical protein
MGQYSSAELSHKCNVIPRAVAVAQAGKLDRADQKLEEQARPQIILRATMR